MNPFNPRFPGAVPHDFAKVARVDTKRSAFKAESRTITMFDEGKLIPLAPIEVIPGDTIKLDVSMLCRLNTPLVPFMSGLNLHSYYFFVPSRILWSNFVYFMGEKNNPGDTTTYTLPVVTGPAAGFAVETVYDYMGIPINMTKNVNALPLRAYNRIYRDFFRDQNIINSPVINTGNGPDTDTDYTVRRVAKYHDYFTSCLPAPQYGSAQSFSLTGSAPVTGIGALDTNWAAYTPVPVYETDGTNPTYAACKAVGDASNDRYFLVEKNPGGNYPNIYADLTSAGGITIADFRETIQLQALAEMENRGGHRYVEILYSVFNVISPDFRLDNPEYLGGSKTPIYVIPVAQTSSTTGSEAQGQLAAYGSAFKTRDGFTKSFTEHGYILPLVCVRSDGSNVYSQGLHRMWTRSTKYDFFNPFLQNIGDQAVLQQEIYLSDNNSSADNTVFGYQERYAEYRYKKSMITGIFRPAYATPLDTWHVSEEFGSQPTLDDTFIELATPVDRVVAVPSEPHFYLDAWFDYKVARPMPVYGIPGLGDRL